jgi:enoyl-CoA hydratase
MGLANRLVEPGTSRMAAEMLAQEIAQFPQQCLRNDRKSTYEQADLSFTEALKNEFGLGMDTITSGETVAGADRFAQGAGRHGKFGE